ncbi:MAG: hypothetical protein K2G64_08600 [Muribaculaceae bacterium]|nr:hypothetical protein [Muribaculaceae bacterium]
MKKCFYLFGVVAMMAATSCSAKSDAGQQATEAETVETTVVETADNQAENEAVLSDLYNSFVLVMDNPDYKQLSEKEADDFINAHISKEMQQQLRDLNDFDDDGLAFWELRTGVQDGDGETKLIAVTSLDDGWYRAEFVDMGTKGQKEFQVKDGVILSYR